MSELQNKKRALDDDTIEIELPPNTQCKKILLDYSKVDEDIINIDKDFISQKDGTARLNNKIIKGVQYKENVEMVDGQIVISRNEDNKIVVSQVVTSVEESGEIQGSVRGVQDGIKVEVNGELINVHDFLSQSGTYEFEENEDRSYILLFAIFDIRYNNNDQVFKVFKRMNCVELNLDENSYYINILVREFAFGKSQFLLLPFL